MKIIFLPEDVAHMRARDNLQGAATHPGLKGELEVFPAPDIEARIIAPELFEKISVDSEQTPRHGGAVHGFCLVTSPVLFSLGDAVPVEHQVPVKAPDSEVGRLLIGERVVINDVYHGADDVSPIPGYPVQQRLEPSLVTRTKFSSTSTR